MWKLNTVSLIWGFRTKEIVKFPMDLILAYDFNFFDLIQVIQVICNRLRLELPVMVV